MYGVVLAADGGFAADANSLASTIKSCADGLTAKVNDEGNTVTVEGEVTGADKNFNLIFDDGVTVIWKASIIHNTFTVFYYKMHGKTVFNRIYNASISR